jgi:hypothetical protein
MRRNVMKPFSAVDSYMIRRMAIISTSHPSGWWDLGTSQKQCKEAPFTRGPVNGVFFGYHLRTRCVA